MRGEWDMRAWAADRDWRRAAREAREDIAGVVQTTDRDDTGVSYAVFVTLRSFAANAYEEGEDRLQIWGTRVDFGQCDRNVAGGSDFVHASREQQRIADEIVAIVWRDA